MASTYGDYLRQTLGAGTPPELVCASLVSKVTHALAAKFSGRAIPVSNPQAQSIAMILTIPDSVPERGRREFSVVITLLVHTVDYPAALLLVVPRVSIEVSRRITQLIWLEKGSDNDVTALLDEVLGVLSQVPPV